MSWRRQSASSFSRPPRMEDKKRFASFLERWPPSDGCVPDSRLPLLSGLRLRAGAVRQLAQPEVQGAFFIE
eukprot:8903152-Pyramimonas_sp.AAC.1